MLSTMEFVAAHVRKSGLFEALSKKPKMSDINNAISYSFWQKPYSQVVAAERQGKSDDYVRPPPFLNEGCARYRIDASVLLVALESAFVDLKYALATGEVTVGGAQSRAPRESGRPARAATFLVRTRLDLIAKEPRNTPHHGALAIVCVSSAQDLFWAVDEFGDPSEFEYREIRSGDGVCVGTRIELTGEHDEDGDPHICNWVFEDEEGGQQLTEFTNQIYDEAGPWKRLGEVAMSAYTKEIPRMLGETKASTPKRRPPSG